RKARGKGKTTKSVSRSSKARLQFSVGPGSSRLVSTLSASADLTDSNMTISNYFPLLDLHVLELAENAARDNKKNRIVPRHILLAVRND
ncbi:Histone H2AX, partial [Linum perenne]